MNLLQKVTRGLTAALIPVLISSPVFAHVVVTPKQVNVAAFQTFTVSVPNEKSLPVTALRLVVPDGLGEVMPSVKAGWEITTSKSGEKVSEISWKGGVIPAGQRDDFTFSAQSPSSATNLQWKAYQTYEDGTVVSWDQPTMMHKNDESNKGPYSVTEVVNDVDKDLETMSSSKAADQTGPYALAGVALILSIISLMVKRK